MNVVVVGMGVAGVNAARIIVAGRPEAKVSIYGAEPYLYYARPKLPAFLAGEVVRESARFYTQEWYDERRIAVHTGARVEALDPSGHRVGLADGSIVAYDRLLVATGAHPFVPPIDGADLPGVFSLWTIDDAVRIRTYAAGCRQAVVIGGGLLGLEAGRALRALGLGVTVVEFAPRLMPRQLDVEGAEVFRRRIEGLGIQVLVGATTERIEGANSPRAAVLQSGQRLPAEMVLIAAGGRPNSHLAKASGLEVNRGIVVNSRLETSAADVYAAGDAAEHAGTVYGIIPAAIEQARVAAQNLAGIGREEYTGTVPTNTLKIVGLDLTSVGQIDGGEGYAELRRVQPEGQYMKLVLKDGHLQGAILLGHQEKVNLVSRAVAQQVDVGRRREELLSDSFDWQALLGRTLPA